MTTISKSVGIPDVSGNGTSSQTLAVNTAPIRMTREDLVAAFEEAVAKFVHVYGCREVLKDCDRAQLNAACKTNEERVALLRRQLLSRIDRLT